MLPAKALPSRPTANRAVRPILPPNKTTPGRKIRPIPAPGNRLAEAPPSTPATRPIWAADTVGRPGAAPCRPAPGGLPAMCRHPAWAHRPHRARQGQAPPIRPAIPAPALRGLRLQDPARPCPGPVRQGEPREPRRISSPMGPDPARQERHRTPSPTALPAAHPRQQAARYTTAARPPGRPASQWAARPERLRQKRRPQGHPARPIPAALPPPGPHPNKAIPVLPAGKSRTPVQKNRLRQPPARTIPTTQESRSVPRGGPPIPHRGPAGIPPPVKGHTSAIRPGSAGTAPAGKQAASTKRPAEHPPKRARPTQSAPTRNKGGKHHG